MFFSPALYMPLQKMFKWVQVPEARAKSDACGSFYNYTTTQNHCLIMEKWLETISEAHYLKSSDLVLVAKTQEPDSRLCSKRTDTAGIWTPFWPQHVVSPQMHHDSMVNTLKKGRGRGAWLTWQAQTARHGQQCHLA